MVEGVVGAEAGDCNCPPDCRVCADNDPAEVDKSGVVVVEPRAAWHDEAHPYA